MNLLSVDLLAGITIIIALAFISVKAGAIDVPGAVLGSLITFSAFAAGGATWLLVIVSFFVISSLLTRFRYDYKRKLGTAQEKGGKRSWRNTLANGGVAAAAAVSELFFHQSIFAVAFLGSVATAMSDTIATEIGLLSNSKPRLITKPTTMVEPGTSGGVTGLGELVALGSGLGIAVLGVLLSVVDPAFSDNLLIAVILAVTIGAIVGTNIDSVLGATIQRIKKCQICGAFTENNRHHETEAIAVKGVSFVDNNAVNFLGIIAGTIVSVAIFLILF